MAVERARAQTPESAAAPLHGVPPSTADRVALAAVWISLAPVFMMSSGSWLVLLFSPVGAVLLLGIGALVLWGALSLNGVLSGASPVRPARGVLPRRYRVIAWVWVVAMVASPVARILGQAATGAHFWALLPAFPGEGTDPASFRAWEIASTVVASAVLIVLVAAPLAVRAMRRVDAPETVAPVGTSVAIVAAGTDSQPGRALVVAPPRVADRLALAAVWLAPPLSLVAKSTQIGYLFLGLIVAMPVVASVLGYGIATFQSTLGRRSRLRARLGTVPGRYRTLAWTWAAAVFAPGFVLLDVADGGGDVEYGYESAMTMVLGLGPQGEWYPGFAFTVTAVCAVVVLGCTVAVVALRRRDAPSPAPPRAGGPQTTLPRPAGGRRPPAGRSWGQVDLQTARGGDRPRGTVTMRIEAVRGDITTERVDAIVNAANSSLLGGGGVDGAIHAAAGPALLAACRELRHTRLPNGLPVGEAVATVAGDLPASWVIHTVGPNRYAGQTDPAQLASCFTRSLDVAAELDARSVAFPAVSAGVYGWDVRDVARIAVDAMRAWAAAQDAEADRAEAAALHDDTALPADRLGRVDLVRFVLFSDDALAAFSAAIGESGR